MESHNGFSWLFLSVPCKKGASPYPYEATGELTRMHFTPLLDTLTPLDSEILQHIFTGDDGMAKLMEQVLNQVLNAQITEQIQAEPYERTEERQAYRNGYRPRTMNTRVGTLVLQVPRLRSGQFSTQLFERYQRSEQALVLALMEMVVNGVSTRKVQRITEELCGVDFSKSTVSALCKQLDPAVNAWNERPIKGGAYPFVLVDGVQIKCEPIAA